MERDALLRKITILDFMALDLHLYLNTHPNDCEALRMYNDVVDMVSQLRCRYEEEAGPLVSYRSQGKKGWEWECGPWPWQQAFNYAMDIKEGL